MNSAYQAEDVLVGLRRIIRATEVQSKRIAKTCGLTIPQIMVLRSIGKLGDVTLKRVSAEVSLSQATVSTILNRLEQRELIVRVRSTQDKRTVNARLTQRGMDILQTVPALFHERFIERFAELTEQDHRALVNTVSQLASMMDTDRLDA